MKRIPKILIAVGIFLVLALLVFMFAEEISHMKRSLYTRLSKNSTEETESTTETSAPATDTMFEERYASHPGFTHSGDAWYQKYKLIYHAGGGVDGLRYTNSREAVEANLPHGNVLEIDFAYTEEHSLVCIHSWDYITGSPEALTLEEFKNFKIYGKYSTMTAQELIELMEEREDLYIVVDTKETETVQIVHDLLQLAENRPDIVDRFVIQLYDKGAKESFLELYPFTNENFLFTCYKFGYDHKAVLSLCMEEDISVVTVTHDVWDSSVIDLFTQKGILVYEHTVNRPDHVQESLKKGVHGFYTDFLTILEP